MMQQYLTHIGQQIQRSRMEMGWTQAELAKQLGTSQSALVRIEKGKQNISIELLARISEVLSLNLISLNRQPRASYRIQGGRQLSGQIETKSSKNAVVALLFAALLNHGTTTFYRVSRIEEVERILEVFTSLGVKVQWKDGHTLVIRRPARLDFGRVNAASASRTRAIILLLGALLTQDKEYLLPMPGGCSLGSRTIQPHLDSLALLGLSVEEAGDFLAVHNQPTREDRVVVLTERGDTLTENVILAASLLGKTVTIRNASPNYMVQDLILFLGELGIVIEGLGTTTLRINGQAKTIRRQASYTISEDPIESMSLIAAAVVTKSELTILRCPMEFLEIELAVLQNMGLRFTTSKEYVSYNGHTRLADVTIYPSQLKAAKDKLHALPFPGVNMDNLPFLGLIACQAEGRSLLHDWSYENRAIYLTELNKLGAQIELIDPYRVYISGPTVWKSADMFAPPALRPSVVIFLAMLAAPGVSMLRNIYPINRGYEQLADRLNAVGADIQTVQNM